MDHLEKFPVTRIGRVCDFTASGQRYQVHRSDGDCRLQHAAALKPSARLEAERNKGKGAKGIGKATAEAYVSGMCFNTELQGKGPVQALQPGQVRRR